MRELINKVKEASGLTDEQAKKSIKTVGDYLKGKMPRAFHSQIDNMLNGGKLSEGIKEKLMDAVVDATEKAEDVMKDAADKTGDVVKNIKEKLNDFLNKD